MYRPGIDKRKIMHEPVIADLLAWKRVWNRNSQRLSVVSAVTLIRSNPERSESPSEFLGHVCMLKQEPSCGMREHMWVFAEWIREYEEREDR